MAPLCPNMLSWALISLHWPNMLLWALIGLHGPLNLTISERNVPFVLVLTGSKLALFFRCWKYAASGIPQTNFESSYAAKFSFEIKIATNSFNITS